jgi:hypothetical protein
MFITTIVLSRISTYISLKMFLNETKYKRDETEFFLSSEKEMQLGVELCQKLKYSCLYFLRS